ncbi:hypothetical protein [Ellagibacter isourolithinifaciens]|uniref:hypothetical protein n=1 Tax=Ellagibacter isourolithinifaciens TaxID=2137581 RepID=UPI003A919127
MTEEKQGAAEWLRGIINEYESNGDTSCSGMAKRFGNVCSCMASCRDCMIKMMTTIADRIDAERALPEGVEWPRFEDGGLVGIGDAIGHGGEEMRAESIVFHPGEWAIWCSREGIDGRLSGSYGERVERPAPKVLDADGVPIKVGNTVYFVDGNGRALIVERIDANDGEPAVDLVYAGERIHWHSANPEKLTHERPDSWKRIEEDAKLAPRDYLEKRGMNPEKTERIASMMADLVRRAKALAKAASEARGVE